jgi:hypothetical protein
MGAVLGVLSGVIDTVTGCVTGTTAPGVGLICGYAWLSETCIGDGVTVIGVGVGAPGVAGEGTLVPPRLLAAAVTPSRALTKSCSSESFIPTS